MKKILALALALVMMLSVSVIAFADDVVYTGQYDAGTDGYVITPAGDMATELQTLTVDEDGNPVAGFTVTIPATVPIPWEGTTAGDYLNWSYASKLEEGKQLSISLDKTGGTFYTDGADKTLAYTLSGDAVGTAFATGEEVTDGTINKQIEIDVTGWNDVPVGAYADTVTFTVAVVDIV